MSKTIKFLRHLSGFMVLSLVAMLSVSIHAIAQGAPPQIKMGFVNTDRVFREASPAKKAEARLEGEFKKREGEINEMTVRLREMTTALDKDAPIMTEAQRRDKQAQIADLDRDLQRRQRDFRDDVNQRRQMEFSEVLQIANRALKQIAEKEGYDVIFQDAVYIHPRLDITDKVIKALATSDTAPPTTTKP